MGLVFVFLSQPSKVVLRQRTLWAHQDDKFRPIFCLVGITEQGANHWHLAEQWHPACTSTFVVGEQSAEDDRGAIGSRYGSLNVAGCNVRNCIAIDDRRASETVKLLKDIESDLFLRVNQRNHLELQRNFLKLNIRLLVPEIIRVNARNCIHRHWDFGPRRYNRLLVVTREYRRSRDRSEMPGGIKHMNDSG